MFSWFLLFFHGLQDNCLCVLPRTTAAKICDCGEGKTRGKAAWEHTPSQAEKEETATTLFYRAVQNHQG